MAEETKTTATVNEGEVTETPATEQQEQENNGKPTVEELLAQIAEKDAAYKKLKAANDATSKSEAELKRQLRARQTAEEQEAEEKAEAQRLADEERESMRKELNHIKAVAAYKELDAGTIDTLIEAVSEADHTTINNIISNEVKKAVKKAEAEWKKSTGNVNAGTGDVATQISKQQFDSMSMADKSKLYRENKAEYDRLNSLK